MADIIVKKGSLELKVDRNDLIDLDETPDGVNFSFKGGLILMVNDQFMDASVKNVMKNSSNSYPGKKLVFDFDNKRHPVMVHGDS